MAKQQTLIEVKTSPVTENRDVRVMDVDLDFSKLAPSGALKDSMYRVGLEQPVVLKEKGSGRYEVLEGRRRIAAAFGLDWATISAKVYPSTLTKKEGASITLSANAVRGDNPLGEMNAIETLTRSGMTEKQIAGQLGVSTAWVNRRVRLHTLRPKLLQRFADGDCTFTTAIEMTKLTQTQQERVEDTWTQKQSDFVAKGKTTNPQITLADVTDSKSVDKEPVPAELFKGLADDPMIVLTCALGQHVRQADRLLEMAVEFASVSALIDVTACVSTKEQQQFDAKFPISAGTWSRLRNCMSTVEGACKQVIGEMEAFKSRKEDQPVEDSND
jgi:ParB/RepB/Spo0J family partition protein